MELKIIFTTLSPIEYRNYRIPWLFYIYFFKQKAILLSQNIEYINELIGFRPCHNDSFAAFFLELQGHRQLDTFKASNF